ncbi:hypothetical protein F0562_018473 [Nyssa sinensis]|uniref:Uncharacterized protein n=1 Tax=Nyssa sinensis TaxID=561372 RepID=A0A5J4ZDE1_9ASTE|nr:hypothetical protein F0562_018473 [Nyssa sinensis]
MELGASGPSKEANTVAVPANTKFWPLAPKMWVDGARVADVDGSDAGVGCSVDGDGMRESKYGVPVWVGR